MRLEKNASGKKVAIITKKEWQDVGKQAGWENHTTPSYQPPAKPDIMADFGKTAFSTADTAKIVKYIIESEDNNYLEKRISVVVNGREDMEVFINRNFQIEIIHHELDIYLKHDLDSMIVGGNFKLDDASIKHVNEFLFACKTICGRS